MKKSFILFGVIAFGLFSSCSDDDSSDGPEDALIGSWQLVSQSENGRSYELDACELEETVIFKSGGTFELIDYDQVEGNENQCVINADATMSGEWSVTKPDKVLLIGEDNESVLVDYSVSGSKLILIKEGINDYVGAYTLTSVYKKK
ncbi:lipocalin family protein [Zobellia uliginosa]|uniref:lipocalin family protein n=1 Tax=Zobellia uliginosa TaxID=143224 RepID=UPI0026E13A73|nr:lipocalin family protein [Zobellia uliginosa]MDO6516478.1 lipocalin family protein [Zobellia uliginosa]